MAAKAGEAKAPEVNPLDRVSCCSRLFWVWPGPILSLAAQRTLNEGDLWDLRRNDKCEISAAGLRESWKAGGTLTAAALRWVRWDVAGIICWSLLWLVAALLGHGFLLRQLLRLLEGDGTPWWHGMLMAAGFGASELLRSVAINQQWLNAMMMGVRMRGALRVLIYDKLLRLRTARIAVGKVVNLSSTDAQRALEACQYGHFLISAPILLSGIVIFLAVVVGPSTLAGFAVLFVLAIFQARFGACYGSVRRAAVRITDERIRAMAEALSGVRLVKQYAWEAAIASGVSATRRRELAQLTSAAMVRAANFVLAFVTPVFVTLAVFATHLAVTGRVMPASDAFTVISVFNVARFPLGVVAIAARNTSEAAVGMTRVDRFLGLPEVDEKDLPSRPAGGDGEDGEEAPPAVAWTAATYAWEQDDQTLEPEGGAAGGEGAAGGGGTEDGEAAGAAASRGGLHEVSLRVRRGELLGVTGPVGAGKSSLLGTLTGQMRLLSGSAELRGRVAQVGQTPWVFNATVRDNVLFGRPMEEGPYRRALEASQLGQDLAELPAGDATEIGERGISLSGGQKARVALARAVYAAPDVVLLDSVMSAVDVHVGRRIWEDCVLGALGGATRLVASHHKRFLEQCDRVVVMDGGRIVTVGKMEDLEASGVELLGLEEEREEEEEEEEEGRAAGGAEEEAGDAEGAAHAAAGPAQGSGAPGKGAGGAAAAPKPAGGSPSGRLMEAEDRATGTVSCGTYASYFRAAGGCGLAYVLLFLLLVGRGSKIASDAWVSVWAEEGARPGADNAWYLGVYAATVAGVVLLNLVQSVAFALISLRASRRLHDRVFAAVMAAGTWWFDSTPTGRILNRFSSDLDSIDVTLPQIMQTCLEFLSQCILAVVVVAAVLPWMLAALPVLVTFFYFTALTFRRAARDLKRLDGVSRSPLVSHLQSSVHGLSSVRAYGETPRYRAANVEMSDANSRAFFTFYATNRWVGFRLDLITNAIAVFSAVLVVLARDTLPAGVAGLALTYALQMAGTFQFSIRLASETEALFTSVERLSYYSRSTPREPLYASEPLAGGDRALADESRAAAAAAAPLSMKHVDPSVLALVEGWDPKSWPAELRGWPWRGRIDVRGLTVGYRTSPEPVLKGVSFSIPAGATLGVVGRTGSGKSTLLQSLFRMLRPASGTICIDGVDTGSAPLYQLRSGLAVVPQDPTLFVGSVRRNLDPFGQADDGACWDALRRAGMDGRVRAMDGGLRASVAEAGSNFSAGERQLLCLARALLRGSRVLVLDEATSQTDAETDAAVQRAVRDLDGVTVLVVAHRLETVLDADSVLVLEGGKVAEMGPPAELLGEAERSTAVGGCHEGLLADMVDAAGPEASAELRAIARGGSAAAARG